MLPATIYCHQQKLIFLINNIILISLKILGPFANNIAGLFGDYSPDIMASKQILLSID
jgi:hypothetical protein